MVMLMLMLSITVTVMIMLMFRVMVMVMGRVYMRKLLVRLRSSMGLDMVVRVKSRHGPDSGN